MTKNNNFNNKKIVILSTIVAAMLFIGNTGFVLADHNEETAQYTRTTPSIDIINGEDGIQVAYWYLEGNSIIANPTLMDFNNDLSNWINAFKLNPWFIAAYAEEATVQVPFDYSGQSGTFFEFDTYYQYLVRFTGDKDEQPPVVERDPVSGYLPGCIDINLVYDVEFDRCITEEQQTKEAIDNYVELTEIEPELTRTEKRLVVLSEKTNPTKNDLEEIAFLEHLDSQCFSTTLVSQTYRGYDVLFEQFRDLDGNQKVQLLEDFSISTSNLRNESAESRAIKMGIQECIGQPFTKKSVQYDNMIVDDENSFYVTHQNNADDVPVWTAARVNEESNKTIETIFDPLCDYHLPDYMMENLVCEETVYTSTMPFTTLKHSDAFQQQLDEINRFKSGDEAFMLDKVLKIQQERNYYKLNNQNVGGQE